MKDNYDFSQSVKNPYIKKPKKEALKPEVIRKNQAYPSS
jgi:hypothetical protein